MADRRLAKIQQYAEFVATHWPDLHEARIPGTRRRWAQTRTRAESRQRANTDDTTIAGIAKASAPVHLDVLDTLADITAISHTLADAVAQLAGVDRLAPPDSGLYGEPSDPRPYLALVAEHLDTAAEVDDQIVDDALDPYSECSIARARSRTATALRMILSGWVLDTDCPWCGAGPLRIEEHADEPLVVCRSRRVCEPPEADCGTWVRDRPAWILPEWEWLARRIDHARESTAVC